MAWAVIAALPPPDGRRGGRWRDHRQVLDAVLWRLFTGAPRRDLPERVAAVQRRAGRPNGGSCSSVGALALAAPAQAYGDNSMRLHDTSPTGYDIGLSTLNGDTFPQGTYSYVATTTWPHPSSLRAVKTGPGWCVREDSYRNTSKGWGRLSASPLVHHPTGANGGYSQLNVATFQEFDGGGVNTSTNLTLHRC